MRPRWGKCEICGVLPADPEPEEAIRNNKKEVRFRTSFLRLHQFFKAENKPVTQLPHF